MDERSHLKQNKSMNEIDSILNRIGFGRYQQFIMLVGGLSLFGDGAELTVISIIVYVLEAEWGLDTVRVGFLSGSIFIGIGLGYLLAGHYTNTFGRLKIFRLSFTIVAIAGSLSGVMPEFWTLLVLRALTGLGIGLSLPMSFSYVIENLPSKNRGFNFVLVEILFGLGQVYIVVLSLIFVPDLDGDGWRYVFLFAALPPFIGIAVSFFLLKESPIFLIKSAQTEECIRVLNHIAATNGKEPLTIAEERNLQMIEVDRSTLVNPLKTLFNDKNKKNTMIFVALYSLLMNGYYGLLYVLPSILQDKDYKDSEVLYGIGLAISVGIPIYIFVLFIMDLEYFGRKGTLKTILGLNLFLCLGAIMVLEYTNTSILISIACGAAICNIIVLNPYCTEVFNTEIRPMSIAIGNGVGRAFGLFIPLIFIASSKAYAPIPFIFTSAFYALCYLLLIFSPNDTLGKALDVDH